MPQQPLKNRNALITGAGKGLGKTFALALAQGGVNLGLVGRNADTLKSVAEEARKHGVTAETFTADISREKDVLDLEKAVASKFQKIHILINNAGINVRKNVTDFTYDEWTSVINTNLVGAFLMCRSFVPRMKDEGYGRIINLTSIMAHVSSTGRGVYSATKHAVAGLTKALALELVDDAITCVAISPGFIATDLTAPLRADPAKNAALMAQTPIKRWGKPEEIAALALYICSDAAAFMTGNDVLIDGGWCAQ